jgi:hypothetical protein
MKFKLRAHAIKEELFETRPHMGFGPHIIYIKSLSLFSDFHSHSPSPASWQTLTTINIRAQERLS